MRLALVVHPDRCAAVRAALAQRATSAASEPVPDFEVRGDDRCAADDCRIETELGSADASLETQLARLAAAWGVAETPVPAAARRAA